MSALLLSVETLPEFVQFFRKPGSLPAMAMELFINMHSVRSVHNVLPDILPAEKTSFFVVL